MGNMAGKGKTIAAMEPPKPSVEQVKTSKMKAIQDLIAEDKAKLPLEKLAEYLQASITYTLTDQMKPEAPPGEIVIAEEVENWLKKQMYFPALSSSDEETIHETYDYNYQGYTRPDNKPQVVEIDRDKMTEDEESDEEESEDESENDEEPKDSAMESEEEEETEKAPKVTLPDQVLIPQMKRSEAHSYDKILFMIDGCIGSGKSTLTQELHNAINYRWLWSHGEELAHPPRIEKCGKHDVAELYDLKKKFKETGKPWYLNGVLQMETELCEIQSLKKKMKQFAKDKKKKVMVWDSSPLLSMTYTKLIGGSNNVEALPAKFKLMKSRMSHLFTLIDLCATHNIRCFILDIKMDLDDCLANIDQRDREGEETLCLDDLSSHSIMRAHIWEEMQSIPAFKEWASPFISRARLTMGYKSCEAHILQGITSFLEWYFA